MEGDVDQDYPKTLGERIHAARVARGMSLRGLARRSGVDRHWLRLIENGERSNASLEVAKKLAVALDVTVGYLAGVEDVQSVVGSSG